MRGREQLGVGPRPGRELQHDPARMHHAHGVAQEQRSRHRNEGGQTLGHLIEAIAKAGIDDQTLHGQRRAQIIVRVAGRVAVAQVEGQQSLVAVEDRLPREEYLHIASIGRYGGNISCV